MYNIVVAVMGPFVRMIIVDRTSTPLHSICSISRLHCICVLFLLLLFYGLIVSELCIIIEKLFGCSNYMPITSLASYQV